MIVRVGLKPNAVKGLRAHVSTLTPDYKPFKYHFKTAADN